MVLISLCRDIEQYLGLYIKELYLARTYVQNRRVLGLLALQNYCRVGFKEKNYYRVGRYKQRDKLLHN